MGGRERRRGYHTWIDGGWGRMSMNYKYKIVEKKVVYHGFFKVEQYRLRHQLFAGGWSEDVQRECLERGHAVAVLPYDPQRDQVVMLEQFRVGALHMPDGPWLLEVVAGMIEPGESRLDVARREAVEEANCKLLELFPMCEFLVSPGGTSETITLFLGRVDASRAGGIHGLDHEHEDIRVHVFAREEALELLRRGRINNATAVIALQWLALNRQRLLEHWGLADGPEQV